MIPYNKNLVSNARTLRKNMTREEKHLWYDFLKKLPFNVRRQHNVENYIVDFYIAEKKIVIEVDGIQHTSQKSKEDDIKRDTTLKKWGIVVLRYSNKDINKNFKAVINDILIKLDISYEDLKSKQTPHPSPTVTPSPAGEG
ncbi:MAG: DUF559 domain-containing protein [Clostridia bacterium]|nr:DUF559 domain-containing protein [Clostridia bacterium]